jgi:hypothetical protein
MYFDNDARCPASQIHSFFICTFHERRIFQRGSSREAAMQEETKGSQSPLEALREHWDDLFEHHVEDMHLVGVALSRSTRQRELRRNEHLAGLWEALGLGD